MAQLSYTDIQRGGTSESSSCTESEGTHLSEH